MRELIEKYGLQNAIRYNGKANSNAILGKVLQERNELKSKINELKREIGVIVNEINKLNLNEQITKLKEIAPELLEEKKEEKKELKEIKSKNPVLRFRPSPSGALHIGHSYVLGINELYREKYNGKLLLIIDDTNPENIYKDAYKLIEKDGRWLANVDKVIYASSRMKIYYKYAEELIKKNKAYVCNCEQEKFKELIENCKECPCRGLNKDEQLKRWKLMFKKYKPGEAVLRIKTNLQDKNPALRDWPAFRINEKKHVIVGKKYRVWPLMNFAVAIDDHELNVSTAIRAKDHMDNAKRQKYIFDYFNWKFPENLFVGRINFTGLRLSATQTRKLIEQGKYEGWDDVRLPFLPALRRRGYQKEAFLRYAKEVGVTEVDKKVSKEDFFKLINAFNTEIIDKNANRYFIVLNPKKIKIKKAHEMRKELDLYPNVRKNGRKFLTKQEFYIQDELEKNKNYRLMHLFNFRNNEFLSEYIDERLEAKLIHWLPVSNKLVKVEVLIDNNKVINGLGEEGLKNVKVGEIIQAERNFFCRLLKKSKNKLYFIYLHR